VKASAAVKENFLANMSHEIRTPLNAVLGFTNILQKTKLETEQREYVDIIQTSGDNLLSIVNDILDLSKIEAGMMRIEEAPFRVSDIISTVETMLKPKAEEKKLQFVVNLDSQVPEIVSGDAVRLTQILVNLVSNSIKFTEEGGVYLRVTMVKKENGVAKLEFLVRDTGIGIPSEKQPTIFDRFEQAEAETTRRFGGTGLGLSIVKNLVELQKGTISLFSQNGNGSSFTVELSFKICDVESTAKREIKKQANISDNSKSKIKVLIAEDNAMNQRLIKHLMQSRGYHFDLVFNGIQAIESLKKQTYDMVLMDIQMPEMDGYTATRQIRNELNLHIPIIAMTAHAMSGEKEKCIRAGMNDYLSKPIDEEILFDLIQQYSRPDLFEHKKDLSGNKGPKVIELRGGGNQNEDMTVFNQQAKRKSLVH
jgi:CheY-like chemotaxis protein